MAQEKQTIPAKRLARGDCFLPEKIEDDWSADGNSGWIVKSHTLTERGDYSTIVECDGATWTERFEPEEMVHIITATRQSHWHLDLPGRNGIITGFRNGYVTFRYTEEKNESV